MAHVDARTASEKEPAQAQLKVEDVQDANQLEHDQTFKQAYRVHRYAVYWCAIVSLSIIMESYDTLIINSFYAYPTFEEKFGVKLASGKYEVLATWESALSGGANACLIIGGFMQGWLVERLGPRKLMIYCHASLIVLLFIIFFAPNIQVLLVGEMLCSLPWGVFASLIPAYAAELCPTALRGYLCSYVNLCWVMGHLIAAGVLRGLVSNTTEWSYKIPFALQWMWPPFLIVAIYFAPESAWWLVRKGRYQEAEKTLRRLYTHDESLAFTEEEHIKRTVALMSHTIETEHEFATGTSYLDCFKGTNLRRTEIACLTWGCQLLPGFVLQNYITYFFELSGVPTTDAYKLSIGVYAVAFTGTFLSWFLQARIGRRTIYISGLCVMAPLMFIVAFLGLAPSGTAIWTSQSALLIVWYFAYGLTIGPIPYIIASEVGASQLRAKTIALARNLYYFTSIINSVAGPYMLNSADGGNLKGKAAFPAGVASLLMILWAYYRLPEMKGKTYEELDILFEKRVPARQFKTHEVDVAARQ